MRILRLHSENVMRLHVVAIRPDRTVVRVTGENGSGKSSVLNSIWYALAGSKSHPSRPIRSGAAKATIRLDLGEGDETELSIIRRFTPSGTYLDVESPEGAVFRSPQALCDKIIGALSFDPLAFTRLSAKAQLEQLRSIVTVDADLDALDTAARVAYESRTQVNRQIASLNERVKTLAVQVDATVDVEPVSIRALMDQIEQAHTHNAAIEREAARRAAESRRLVGLENEIDRIRDEIAILEDRLADVKHRHAASTEALRDAAPLPAPIDTALLRVALDEAQEANARKAEQARARAAHQAAADELARAAADAIALSATIEDAQATKADAIARATMPVAGLSFGEGEITYRGIPFAQASSAEQIRVAVAIGMALNPTLRILCIRDGSLLDETSLQLIHDMAEEHDFQVWLESVAQSATVGIHMVDGSVAAVDGEPVPTAEDAEDLADITPVGA
jgi:hypothetical protein